LTGVIDAIATSDDYEIAPASSGVDGSTTASVYRLVAQEKGGSPTAPAVMFTFGTGGMANYKSQSGDFLVTWKVDGHDAIVLNAGAGRWTSPAMVEQMLPELTTVAAWLAVKDPAHELVLSEIFPIGSGYESWVGFSITDPFAVPNPKTTHYIAVDIAHVYGDGRAQVWYHPSGSDYGEKCQPSLQAVLDKIRQ
jgi:hypothetical protein